MYNIFFLGAGFSKPAELPLGDGLWAQALQAAKSTELYEKNLKSAIYEYLDYYYGATGNKITEEEIKLEEFMSYLDIDRHLALHGGDYTAPEESLKNLISYILHGNEKKITNKQYGLYEKFAERLGPHDIVFTFNYDTVLERALKRKNVPYRLYPFRYKHDEKAAGLIIDGKEEVTILKMHGSINWFDKSRYQEWKDDWLKIGHDREPPFAVFDGRMNNEIHRLLDEPFPQNDPLKNIYIVENLDRYFDTYFWYDRGRISDSPFIIAPSHHKLISLSYLSKFWGGFTNSIIGPNRIVIIGFSLPQHDDYIRQPLYWSIRNFYKFGEPMGGKKSKLKIIDLRKDKTEIDEFKSNYRFVDEEWTDFYFKGFCEEAIDVIFSEE